MKTWSNPLVEDLRIKYTSTSEVKNVQKQGPGRCPNTPPSPSWPIPGKKPTEGGHCPICGCPICKKGDKRPGYFESDPDHIYETDDETDVTSAPSI